MCSLYAALTPTGCFEEMEASEFSPKHTKEMSYRKGERFKYSNAGAYEMRIINMVWGRSGQVNHGAHVTLLSGICSGVSG